MTSAQGPESTTTAGRGVTVLAGEGKVYRTFGIASTLKARGEDTGRACEVMEALFPPQVGMLPHVHRQTDEAVYVLQGVLSLQIGDRPVTASAGSFGFIPRSTVHAMQNTTAEPCRVLLWQMPGPGMEQLLEELAQLPDGPPDMSRLLAIFQKYDTEPVAPPQQ